MDNIFTRTSILPPPAATEPEPGKCQVQIIPPTQSGQDSTGLADLRTLKQAVCTDISPLEMQIYLTQKFLQAGENELDDLKMMTPLAAAYYKEAAKCNAATLNYTHQKLGSQDTSVTSGPTLDMLEGLQEKRELFRRHKYGKQRE